jgi:uncharacterized protein YbaR (Trm112 family)
MALNTKLLEILACPKCKGELDLLPKEDGLACKQCDVVYPVRDEIPIMLIDEAVPRQDWESEEDRPS